MTTPSDPKVPGWYAFLVRIGRLRPSIAWAVSIFWSVFGGLLTLLVMRFLLVDRMSAETVSRMYADSIGTVHAIRTDSTVGIIQTRLDTLRNSQIVNLRAVCLDHTKFQQALLGVDCPPNLYKGADK